MFPSHVYASTCARTFHLKRDRRAGQLGARDFPEPLPLTTAPPRVHPSCLVWSQWNAGTVPQIQRGLHGGLCWCGWAMRLHGTWLQHDLWEALGGGIWAAKWPRDNPLFSTAFQGADSGLGCMSAIWILTGHFDLDIYHWWKVNSVQKEKSSLNRKHAFPIKNGAKTLDKLSSVQRKYAGHLGG